MSIRTILLVASAVCPLGLFAVSCGGSDSDLFGNTVSSSSSAQATSTSTGTSTGSGSTSSGGGEGGSSSSGSNSSASAGGAGGGGVGGSGGQNTGGSMSSAGGAGNAQSSAMSSGAGGGPTVPQVYCNNQPCAPGEVCCWDQSMFGGSYCGASGSCGPGYAQVECNDLEDCAPNEICCGDFAGFPTMTYQSIQCVPMMMGCAPPDYLQCEGHPEICPPMQPNCNVSPYLGTGFSICQP